MESVTLKTDKGHTCQVYLHGAHVTSWKTPDGKELLFVSEKAVFAPPKAIRGGIPVCFPQFGMMGAMPTQHGFVRNVSFTVEDKKDWSVRMVYDYDGTSQPSYPYPFKLIVTTELCESVLQQTLEVLNTGSSSMTFTAALHTYFGVSDIHKASVTGLKGVPFLDNMQALAKYTDNEEAVSFKQETDRVYVGAPGPITVKDGASGARMVIERRGFPDAVVWNPWIAKAAAMADFGDDEWQRMVCVEPAVAGSGAVNLKQGDTWQATQRLMYSPTPASA